MKKVFSLFFLLLFLFFYPNLGWSLDLTLAWNPNIESDLAGYRIYQSQTSGGPYTRIGEIKIISTPTPTFTFSVLLYEGTYYFVATAFDKAGNESPKSDEAWVQIKTFLAPRAVKITVITTPQEILKK